MTNPPEMLQRETLKSETGVFSIPLRPLRDGIAEFSGTEIAGSVIMLAAAVLAMVLANSHLSEYYFAFWEKEFILGLDGFLLRLSLHAIVNDALMALFFLIAGLEIKREIIVGELSRPRQAILPIVAALGGMVVPALIYSAFNAGSPSSHGWGIPMATDIAFTLGALALLGRRIPPGVRVFLLSLAIVDDIGAIIVIAIFYSGNIHWGWLGLSALLTLLLFALPLLRVRSPLIYVTPAIVLWYAFLTAGIHPSIAGVIVAFAIPARSRYRPLEVVARGRQMLDEIEQIDVPDQHVLANDQQQIIAQALQKAARHMQAPLQRLELSLHPVTTYLILPLFALANAGFRVEGVIGGVLTSPVALGIILGLTIGKPVGIMLFSWLAIRLRLARKPPGVTWHHLAGASCLGGIGFTVAIFIATLAFPGSPLLTASKLGIVFASLASGVIGVTMLSVAARRRAGAG